MKTKIIERIKKIREKGDLNSFSEDKTKQGIILPLLQCLGWNFFDTDEVFPEYSVAKGKVDYALRYDNKSKVLIEAKKVGEELDKHQEQLVGYSFHESAKMAILTNGITWLFYLPLMVDVHWDQRKFFTINLREQEEGKIAESFMDFLSRENVVSDIYVKNAEDILKSKQKRQEIADALPEVWNRLLSEPHSRLIDLISDETETKCCLRPEEDFVIEFIYKNVLHRNDIPRKVKIEKTDKSIEQSAKSHPEKSLNPESFKGKKPKSFYLKGKTYNVKNWVDLWSKFLEQIYLNESNFFIRVSKIKGSKRKYFSTISEELIRPKKIKDTDIYYECNWSTQEIIKLCLRILDIFGYSPEDFSIEIAE